MNFCDYRTAQLCGNLSEQKLQTSTKSPSVLEWHKLKSCFFCMIWGRIHNLYQSLFLYLQSWNHKNVYWHNCVIINLQSELLNVDIIIMCYNNENKNGIKSPRKNTNPYHYFYYFYFSNLKASLWFFIMYWLQVEIWRESVPLLKALHDLSSFTALL